MVVIDSELSSLGPRTFQGNTSTRNFGFLLCRKNCVYFVWYILNRDDCLSANQTKSDNNIYLHNCYFIDEKLHRYAFYRAYNGRELTSIFQVVWLRIILNKISQTNCINHP